MSKFAVDKAFIFQQIYIINISVDLHSMKEAKRIASLEKENFELKEEVDTLFNTVVQLKESMNLLVSRYIVNEKSR